MIEKESQVYEQGKQAYIDNPWDYKSPYPVGTREAVAFEKGWDEADFEAAVEGGYFDWVVDE